MRVIGLTGGLGSGKSTVSQFLQELVAVILDADKVGHKTYLPDTPAWTDLIEAFGQEIVGADREIDRKKLGPIGFSDPRKRREISSTVSIRLTAIATLPTITVDLANCSSSCRSLWRCASSIEI